ncbi:MAG: hypothetical protein QG608_669 [Actinomycetota bacterium]|nr:hypothetical protein [Actinomycetota bacterium]
MSTHEHEQDGQDAERHLLRDLPPDLPQPRDRFEQICRRVRRRQYRQGLSAGFAGVAAVALLVPAVSHLMTGDDPDAAVAASAPPSCPAKLPGQVPPGSGSVPHSDRLVPVQAPAAAVLCSYKGAADSQAETGTALSGSRQLTGSLEQVAQDLAWLPRKQSDETKMCTMMAGPSTSYLLGLTYPDGVVWVSTVDDPNGCADTTNGTFASPSGTGALAKAAFASGGWSASPGPDDGCDAGLSTGRLGQELAMVPDEPSGLWICDSDAPGDGARREIKDRTRIAQLAKALNGLPASTRPAQCEAASPTREAASARRLRFDYEKGPDLQVTIDPACRPQIDNGARRATLTEQVQNLVEALAAG